MFKVAKSLSSKQPLRCEIFSSLSVIVEQTAGSEGLQSYDVVAAVPCCQRSFEVLCKDSDVDVISLPSGKRLPFNITKKNVRSVGSCRCAAPAVACCLGRRLEACLSAYPL